MTTPDDRISLIRKLLAKAAGAATPEEADAFNAKATALMLKYAIDEALVAPQDRTIRDDIVQRTIVIGDIPKAYSHEFATIGCRVAEKLSCRGLVTKSYDNRTHFLVVGHQSDVEAVIELYRSLVIQCTLQLGTWWKRTVRSWMSGPERYHARRGFITGFATGAAEKVAETRRQVVRESGGHGAELVLVARKDQVEQWLNRNMAVGRARGRKTDMSARGAGFRAGQQAHLGGAAVHNTAGRPAIGR